MRRAAPQQVPPQPEDADGESWGGSSSTQRSPEGTVAARLSAKRRQDQARAAETQRAKEEAAWEETMTRELEQIEKQRRWARKNRQAGSGAGAQAAPAAQSSGSCSGATL